jgi:uncharacterized protein YndB with AHSA1/START domain
MENKITVEATINALVDKVWEMFNEPEHVMKWNHASDDWHSPRAENDLRAGGSFNYRMESKDGSQGFDFGGEYTEVEPNRKIAYVMADGRKAEVSFEDMGGSTHVTTSFDPEKENLPEFQRAGWQAILDNFKKYAEGQEI